MRALLVGSVGILLCAGCYLSPGSDADYIQEKTGIQWPAGTDEVLIVNDPAFINATWVEAHIRLPKDEARNIRARHEFKVFHKAHGSALAFMRGLDKLPPKYRDVVPEAQLYVLAGNLTGHNPFTVILDITSGSMWIQVFHPDSAGEPRR